MAGPAIGETIGLLTLARKHGERDVYAGKRAWVRYVLGMQIDVTTDPTTPSTAWSVVMHNVSGGGIGVWSKRALPVGSLIHIRDHTHANSSVWLPARVTHSTIGFRGHLIGALFDHPAPADDPSDPGQTCDRPPADESTAAEVSERREPPIRSLSMKGAFESALASTLAIVIVLTGLYFVPAEIDFMTRAVMAAVCATVIGACCGWITAQGEARFLRSLQAEIRSLAMGTGTPLQLGNAPAKEVAGVRRAFLDLSARWRKREDDDRLRRQKLEEITQIKSNILSIVSHDMRTPLTSILLYAQMLTEELRSLSEEDQLSFLKIISDECTRLSRLVDDLLEVQRLESGRIRWNLQHQDLSATIRACVRVFEVMAVSKSLELVVNCPSSLPSVVADADKISQVLSNLLSNAIKYTPPGGKVELAAEARGSEIVLCVADNGPGIPRDKWDQIFDRFAQLSEANLSEATVGLGLGLYIVNRIVQAHGGTAWVNSEVGRGSQFYVSLPTRESSLTPRTEPETTLSAGRVVVCDPDPELAATMAQALRQEKLDVRVAHCGSRLLSQLHQGDVDVVVTDLLMPDMNGTELLGALNSVRDRSFRTIIHSYEGEGPELTRKGVDVFLRRPVSKEDLVSAVRLAMRKRSAAGLTVLVLDSAAVDTARLTCLLSDAGHTPVVAGSMNEAVALVRDHAIHAILLSSQSLTATWAELKQFGITGVDVTRLVVLCDAVRKHERRMEEEHRVTVVPYRRGREEAVLDILMTNANAMLEEITQ